MKGKSNRANNSKIFNKSPELFSSGVGQGVPDAIELARVSTAIGAIFDLMKCSNGLY